MRATEPRAALVIACIALFVALGGSAYAVGSRINGASLVNHSVAGTKLKDHTLGGAQINAARLPTVPSATRASTATSLAGHSFITDSESATIADLPSVTITCVGPGASAGTVQIVFHSHSTTNGRTQITDLASGMTDATGGDVTAGSITSFGVPVNQSAQFSLSYEDANTILSGVFLLEISSSGCSTFGTLESANG